MTARALPGLLLVAAAALASTAQAQTGPVPDWVDSPATPARPASEEPLRAPVDTARHPAPTPDPPAAVPEPPRSDARRAIAPRAMAPGAEPEGDGDTRRPSSTAPPARDLPARDLPAHDEATGIVASSSWNARDVQLGDAVELTVTVAAREGDDISLPTQPFSPFELLGVTDATQPGDGGKVTHRFHLRLIALESGPAELEPIRVRVLAKENQLVELAAPVSRVEVRSRLENEPAAKLKPATKPVAVHEDDYTLAYIAGALALLAVAALGTWWFVRWYDRRAKAAAPPPPPKPPWDTALGKLAALGRSQAEAAARGELVAWVDRVSDVLREYLGARFDFEGLESTTGEIVARLGRSPAPADVVTEIRDLLAEADLVKFARVEPSSDASVALLQRAEGVVRRTMFVPAQPVAALRADVTAAPASGGRP